MSDILERLNRQEELQTWYDGGYRHHALVNPDGPEAAAEITNLRQKLEEAERERDKARVALETLIAETDKCPRHETGAGGMTIDAQLRRTVINRVPAMVIEDAREVLGSLAALGPEPAWASGAKAIVRETHASLASPPAPTTEEAMELTREEQRRKP